MLWEKDDVRQALTKVTDLLKREPTHTRALGLRAAIHESARQYPEARADCDQWIGLDAKNASAYYLRGSVRFKSGDVVGSLADFDQQIALDPPAEQRHWQRGLSYYYAGEFSKGRRQFELYQTYHGGDVENVVWRLLCQARETSWEQAQRELLPLTETDRRIPLMTIYDLYRGKATVDEVWAQVEKDAPAADELNVRRFYAHLYVGLYHEARGEHEQARKHLRSADQLPIPHYMWDVAHLHASRFTAEPTPHAGATNTAAEWPQILGPHRNGVVEALGLPEGWATRSGRVVWQVPVGEGFAGVAVAQDRVMVFHRIEDQEVVDALQAASGERLWRWQAPSNYRSTIASDSGPRCVPLVHEGAVYVHGVEGRVACLDLANGQLRWSRETRRDFQVPEGYFGVGSTPLVIGNRLLVNVGGRDGAGIVAFRLADGQVAWKSTDEKASYSSPVAMSDNGLPRALFLTRLNLVSLDPQDGRVLFRVPFGQLGPTVNAANPVVLDDHVFLSASYGVGATLVRSQQDQADVVWNRDDLMSSQYVTSVSHEGAMFGVDGRDDLGTCRLRAFDPHTGKVHWSQDDFGMASLIRVNDTLLAMKTDGQLVRVQATAAEYRELGRRSLTTKTCRALPAFAGRHFYVRDADTLWCVDLCQDDPAPQ